MARGVGTIEASNGESRGASARQGILPNARPKSSRNLTIQFFSQRQTPLALASVSRYFPAAVAKTYVVTFRSHNDDRPSKFIVVADNRKQAINTAWEHGGPDFQVRFDKSTAQAQEMKEGGAAGSMMNNPVIVADILLWESFNLLLLIPVVIGLVMLTRWKRGRPVFTERDWL